jgi:hypothetical protein
MPHPPDAAQRFPSQAASLRRYYPDQVVKGIVLSRFPGTPCSFKGLAGQAFVLINFTYFTE